MSFMFNPYPYDDYHAVNRPAVEPAATDTFIEGNDQVCRAIVDMIEARSSEKASPLVIGLDGYASADYRHLLHLVERALFTEGVKSRSLSVDSYMKSARELDSLIEKNLPTDKEIDPILLFGHLYTGSPDTYFDKKKVEELKKSINEDSDVEVYIIYGTLSGAEILRDLYDMIYYIDVIPKDVVARFKRGKVQNIGDNTPKTYRELMRRAYYCDFELCQELRTELLQKGLIDFYITGSKPDAMQMLSFSLLDKLCAAQVQRPFRCKPVYNEGVWGGFYTKKYRGLPKEMKNCAWVFDLIPAEVSLLMEVGSSLVDIPFYTLIRMQSRRLLGDKSVETFGEYFPMRFNYDDTMHSSGNMSIQVHPGEEYCMSNFSELGRQDESYYIVAAGLDAKTYCGFNEGVDTDEFMRSVKESETQASPVDYKHFVNAVPTRPGMQFLLPGGTIHSSGRNQMVLEIGSLTIGSYTFKLYDYLRKDLDGTPRPIHSIHGENVLKTDRRSSWVKENLMREPKVLSQEGDATELELGRHEMFYFTLRRLDFQTRIRQNTEGKFHVLALVDGERVRVVSESDDSLFYEMNYLDIIVVPACLGAYRIENMGDHPVSVHKTLLV